MTAVVFLGPSLRPSADADVITFLPPAGQGDLYRAALQRPRVIGLIDGHFEGVPSILHKEILWALAQGIAVVGAASMGALRAAELFPFGMEGVGRIFEAYRDGMLEDDDEVAVLHGPSEAGYVGLTEPMVNVRATLEAAAAGGIVSPAQAERLCALAKALFYKHRTWDRILDAAADSDLDPSGVGRLRAWLAEGRIDVKADDARALLDRVRALLADPSGQATPDFPFEWTQMWDLTATRYAADPAEAAPEAAIGDRAVLDELLLDAAQHKAIRDGALARLLAAREAFRNADSIEGDAKRAALRDFRDEREIYHQAALVDWAAENDLDEVGFDRLLTDEARLKELRGALEPALRPHLVDELRLRGTYPALARRAREKRRLLATVGQDDPTFQSTGLTPATLAAWYFAGEAIPDDLEAYARNRGFEGRQAFQRALLREYVFRGRAANETGRD